MTGYISRRNLFKSSVLGIGGIALFSCVATAEPARAATPVLTSQALLDRRREYLTGARAIARLHDAPTPAPFLADIDARVQLMSDSASALLAGKSASLPMWSDLPLAVTNSTQRTNNLAAHFQRLFDIALAWGTPGTSQSGDSSVMSAVVEGLDVLSQTEFAPFKPALGNWWHWEIGIPDDVMNTLTILGANTPVSTRDRLLAAARYFAPSPLLRGRSTNFYETGANLADKGRITTLRGLLDGTAAEIIAGRDAFVGGGVPARSLFRYVTSGDGFYKDGSFVQHDKIAYTGTYGVVALESVAQEIDLLAGSEWAFTEPSHRMIYDTVEDTFAPYLVNGRMMDTVRGRAVARRLESDAFWGFRAMSSTLLLADTLPERAERLQSLVRGWASRYDGPFWTEWDQLPLSNIVAVATLRDSSQVAAAGPLIASYFHAGHERLVHRREAWSFAVSTSSNRIGRYEGGDAENSRGWHQGDGASYLYTAGDAGQFAEDYWPTVDALALPGITATTAPQKNMSAGATSMPPTSAIHNGGLAFSDRAATVGTEVLGYTATGVPTLRARKSWYTFDDCVVCLGSDISDSSGTAVSTTIENRGFRVGESPVVSAQGRPVSLSVDGPHVTYQRWIHVDGVGGYIMLSPSEDGTSPGRVRLQRNRGRWNDIFPNGDASPEAQETIERDYLRIDIAHGVNPSTAKYAYLLAPGADKDQTRLRAAIPGVAVQTVAGVGHTVSHALSRTTFFHFFAAGRIGAASSTHPVVLGWTERGSRTEFLVADPTRKATSVEVRLPFALAAFEQGGRVSWTPANPSVVTVDLSGTRGQAVQFTGKVVV